MTGLRKELSIARLRSLKVGKDIDKQLIDALEGTDTFVLGDPKESEYMKRLKQLFLTWLDELVGDFEPDVSTIAVARNELRAEIKAKARERLGEKP